MRYGGAEANNTRKLEMLRDGRQKISPHEFCIYSSDYFRYLILLLGTASLLPASRLSVALVS